MTTRELRRPRRLLSLSALAAAGALVTACDLETVSTELEPRALDAIAVSDIRIDVGGGRLDVIGVEALEQIEVTATLVSYALRDVDDAREDLTYRLEQELDRAFLRVALDDDMGWVDVKVLVPSRLLVDIEDGSGGLEVRDVRSLRLKDGSGDVIVRGIAEDVVITDESGDLDLEVIGGATRITDDSGEIRLSSVAGRVEIADESGDLSVRDTDDDVRITDGSGSIRVERARGRVEITDGSGDITLIDAPDAWVMEDDGGEVYRR